MSGQPTVGSLCTGYGGLDMAVCALFDAQVIWHADPHPAVRQLLAVRWPGVPNVGDITVAGCWDGVERPDILAGGFPCQPYSQAGPGHGAGDARDLWPAVADAVRALRPRLCVLENVAGFAARDDGIGRTLTDLASLGYDARWTRLPASVAGAPHPRERWAALAWPAADAERGGRPERAGVERAA